ncbi:hypothetical protein FG167_02300 [Lacinutrix sp. WUR7]|uniref:hypothetical protein n=1 Tax=Lacinutrix sp. WUR7 TaxID=2653681 RepID=UPI00193C9172|nr:hypothetical protein [Lacinutrix sp. WUR7]QRM88100.1 hypothetical protein FG167_02300 [Lacinutrix sp. WUR7]
MDIDGNSIWLKLKNEGHLGAITFSSDTNVPNFLKTLKQALKELGIQKLYIQLLEGTPNQILMEKSIQSLESWHIGAKSFDDRIPTKNINLVYGDIDTFI